MSKGKLIFYIVKIGGIFLIVIISVSFLIFSLRPKLLYFKKTKEEMKKNQMMIEKFDRDKELFQKETEDEKILRQKVKEGLNEKIKVLNSEEEIFAHFSSLLKIIKDHASSLGIKHILLQSQSKSFTINLNPDPSLPFFIKGVRETGMENVEGEENLGEAGRLNFIGFKILFSSDIKTSANFIRTLPSLPNLLSIEKIEIYSQEHSPVYVLYLKFYFKRGESA